MNEFAIKNINEIKTDCEIKFVSYSKNEIIFWKIIEKIDYMFEKKSNDFCNIKIFFFISFEYYLFIMYDNLSPIFETFSLLSLAQSLIVCWVNNTNSSDLSLLLL